MSIKRNLRKYLAGFTALAVLALTAVFAFPATANDYVRGIVITVDGEDYYLAGAPDGPNGEFDIPGHDWVQIAPNRLLGRHFNTGPFGASQWWSSDADDGSLLYEVEGIIDTWTPAKAGQYAAKGFVHYHELISVSDGANHPRKVVWLRHIPKQTFTLDGGPHAELAHLVDLNNPLVVLDGVHYQFIPNFFMPYSPE